MIHAYRNVTVGADPEVFWLDKEGKPLSVEGKLGGTKREPLKMADLPNGFFVQEDNVAAEYNIPPTSTERDFVSSITRGLKYIQKQAKRRKASICLLDALHFDEKQLNTVHAQTLGCEPDWNVWTLEPNPPARPPATLRTAAGHVHVGWEKADDDSKIALGRLLDLFLGVPSVLAFKKSERRSLYGRSGAVRFKDYGIEYRVLPNTWIGNQKQIAHVFKTVHHTIARAKAEGDFLIESVDFVSDDIQDAINNYNFDKAIKLVKNFSLETFPA